MHIIKGLFGADNSLAMFMKRHDKQDLTGLLTF